MSKLEAKEQQLAIVQTSANALQEQYTAELETNPKYSLDVDPEKKYSMTDQQKAFVKHYVEFKNVNTAAELAGIDIDTAKQYFVAYSTQQEVRRINLALYHRQFNTKLISIDEIGGYLTSLLTGENVPIGDQLKTSEKLRVVELLIRLNELKQNALLDPTVLMMKDIDIQIKNLSVATISQLLKQSNKTKKPDIVQELDDDSLTVEEKAYLSTLPASDLLQIIEETNKGGNKHDPE